MSDSADNIGSLQQVSAPPGPGTSRPARCIGAVQTSSLRSQLFRYGRKMRRPWLARTLELGGVILGSVADATMVGKGRIRVGGPLSSLMSSEAGRAKS